MNKIRKKLFFLEEELHSLKQIYVTCIIQKPSQLLTSSFKFQNLLFCDQKKKILKKIRPVSNENTYQFVCFKKI